MSMKDFKMGKLIGKGAFGSVSIVTRKTDGKIYAMKSVNIGKLNNKEKESSLNEIRILASLSHPNIIGYKEAFFDQSTNTLNIVMEFADEGDLEKKIKNNLKKRLNFEEDTIWNWTIQLLKGIKYLHDNRIMHRDLKCANIFLMKSGLLKLGDLNVSKFAKFGMANTQTGTPYYCSPEIWKEKPYDYKSDIWSLGCIIYEICNLRPPFRGTSLSGLKNNVLNGHYLPIPSIYSNDLSIIIAKMLVIDPNKRYSANELLEDEIIKNKIKNIDNLFTNNINGKYNFEKANLIKTIRLPLNIKEINSKLPKKRYNPEEEMLKNDEYETMKQTYFQNLKKQEKENNNYHKRKDSSKTKNIYKKKNENKFSNKYNKKENKENKDLIKDNNKIERKNRNLKHIEKIPNNNFLNKSEENKISEDFIFNKNLNYQYEQALKNNYKLRKFYSKNMNKEEIKAKNYNKYNEFIEKLLLEKNNINHDNNNNQKKKKGNLLINNINNKNYKKLDEKKYSESPYNLIINNKKNKNIDFSADKKNRYKNLFNDENDIDNDDNIFSEVRKPLNVLKSAFHRQNKLNFKLHENSIADKKINKQKKRPITSLPSKINMKRPNNHKKNKDKINNLYDKYKNKISNKINLNGFKYVPQKRQVYKIAYDKLNYNDYCKKNKIDKNKNYHYYRENGYYNYRNAMRNYGNFAKNKNMNNKKKQKNNRNDMNKNNNNFNNYLRNEFRGGGGAGYAARIRLQKYNYK